MTIVKKILKLIIAITVCVIFIIGTLPSILSTDLGKKWVLSFVNEMIPGKVEVENIQLSWFGNQSIKGFELKDPHGINVVSVQELHVEESLASYLLTGMKKIPLVKVFAFESTIELQEKTINLSRALGIKQTAILQDMPSIQFFNINGYFGTDESGELVVSLRGNTRQQNVDGSFNLIFVKDRNNAQVEFENFPVAFLDYAAGLSFPTNTLHLQDVIGNLLQLKLIYFDGQHFALDASSPMIDMKLSGSVINQTIRFDPQALISWKLPAGWVNQYVEKFTRTKLLQVNRMVHTLVKIDQLEIPTAFFSKNSLNSPSSTLAIKAEAEVLENEIKNFKGDGNIALEGLTFTIQAPFESKQMDITLNAKARHDDKPIQFKFNGALAKPSHFNALTENLLKEMKLKMETIGLNDLLGLESKTSENTEERGSGFLSLEAVDGTFIAEGSYQSPQVNILIPRFEGAVSKDQITITKPAKMEVDMDQTVANRFLGLSDHLIFLNRVQANLDINEMLADHFFFVNLGADLNPFQIYVKSLENTLEVTKLSVKLNTAKEQVGTINLNVEAKSEEGIFKEIFGESVRADINGNVNKINFKRLSVDDLKIDLTSDVAQVKVIGDFDTKIGFHLKEQLHITFPTAQKIIAMVSPSLGIQPSSKITLSINETDEAIKFDKPSTCFLTGRINVPELFFTEQNIALKNIIIPWRICGASNTIEMGFSAKTSNLKGKEAGSVEGNLIFSDFIHDNHLTLDRLKVKSSLKGHHLPLSLIEVFGNQLAYRNLLEDYLDFSCDTDLYYDSIPRGVVNYTINGKELNTSGKLNVGEKITLTNQGKPTYFKIALTPKRFETLRKLIHNDDVAPAKIVLLKDGILEGQVNNLTFFHGDTSKFTLENSALDLSLNMRNLRIKDVENNAEYDFPSIAVSLSSELLKDKIDFTLLSEESTKGNDNGKISIKGYIENLFTPEGNFYLWNSNINLNGHAQRLPISLFTRIIKFSPNMDKSVEALLGKSVNADITLGIREWNGPVFAKVTGENGDIFIDGQLKEGILRLSKPLEAKITVTPELGTYVFADLLPLFGSITESDSKITVLINPKGFRFPVNNFQFSKVHISGGTLSLGKVKFKNEGTAATLLNVLNQSDYSHLSLWCTPCHFNVINGVLGIARMDVLVTEKYPIAFWGKVDLIRDKVNLVIGLSGKTISKAFNMSVKDDVMVTLPLKGTIGKASINKTKAITKLASIAAKKAGDPGSLLIGTVLDIATGNILDQDVPKPTTNPLPWD